MWLCVALLLVLQLASAGAHSAHESLASQSVQALYQRVFRGGRAVPAATPRAVRDLAGVPGHHVALTNIWEQQFVGHIFVGTPPQKLRCVFDSGSSQIVVTNPRAYSTAASSSFRSSAFATDLAYGSGATQGRIVHDDVSLGGFDARGLPISVSSSSSAYFKKFRFDAIVGMSLEAEDDNGNGAGFGYSALDSTDNFGRFCRANSAEMDCAFALFLSFSPNAQGSQLTIGGIDSTKVLDGAEWQHAPVVRWPPGRGYNFWTVRMDAFVTLPSGARGGGAGGGSQTWCGGNGGCIAMIDTGTSFIGIGVFDWPRVASAVTSGNDCVPWMRGLQYKCKVTQAQVSTRFPTLYMHFAPNVALELKPSDYVECYDGWAPYHCRPRLRKNMDHPDMNVYIFGDFFIRKYYTLFDHSAKSVGFVCAAGRSGCRIPPAPT